jgi:hypothetical protein
LTEKKKMKLAKQFVRGIGLFFAAVVALSISMAAQQEVSPDHFDDNPVVAKKSKPAPAPAKQVAAKKPGPAANIILKSKPVPVQHESAQTAPAPVQTAANRQ